MPIGFRKQHPARFGRSSGARHLHPQTQMMSCRNIVKLNIGQISISQVQPEDLVKISQEHQNGCHHLPNEAVIMTSELQKYVTDFDGCFALFVSSTIAHTGLRNIMFWKITKR
ncbi:unnamed protein product [Caenorhabditis brenneri]